MSDAGKHSPSICIHDVHPRNLLTFLVDIVLVDADGIDPDEGIRVVGETLDECVVAIASDLEHAAIYHDRHEDQFAPCVRYRVVLTALPRAV